jgi:hypothetical protein
MSVTNSVVPKIAINSLELLLLSWEAARSYDKFALVFLFKKTPEFYLKLSHDLTFPLQIFSPFILTVDAI